MKVKKIVKSTSQYKKNVRNVFNELANGNVSKQSINNRKFPLMNRYK